VAALLDLLVLDRDNPRSLSWVAQTLRGRLAKLAGSAQGELDALAQLVPDPECWELGTLCTSSEDGTQPMLDELLAQCAHAAWRVSEEISLRYFTHTGESGQSLGA